MELEEILICDEEGCRNTQHVDCSHMTHAGIGNWYCDGCQVEYNGVHKHHRHSPKMSRIHNHRRKRIRHAHVPKGSIKPKEGQMEDRKKRQSESGRARRWLQEHSSGKTNIQTKKKTKTIQERKAQSIEARRWLWEEKYRREKRNEKEETECICGGTIQIWKQGDQIWIECEGICGSDPIGEERREPSTIRPKQQLTNREIEAQARETNKAQLEMKTRKLKTHPKHRYAPDKYAQYEKRRGEDPEAVADEMFDFERAEEEIGQGTSRNINEYKAQERGKQEHTHSPWQTQNVRERQEISTKEQQRQKNKKT